MAEAASEKTLRDRLLKAYRAARKTDDGRRVSRRDLHLRHHAEGAPDPT